MRSYSVEMHLIWLRFSYRSTVGSQLVLVLMADQRFIDSRMKGGLGQRELPFTKRTCAVDMCNWNKISRSLGIVCYLKRVNPNISQISKENIKLYTNGVLVPGTSIFLLSKTFSATERRLFLDHLMSYYSFYCTVHVMYSSILGQCSL